MQEIDKQYEVNNNAELDNGVYHDFNVPDPKLNKGDSLRSDCKQAVTSNDQLRKLENMMLRQDKAPLLLVHAVTEQQRPPLNEAVLAQTVALGFDASFLRASLERCELNCATTTYYLLQIQRESTASHLSN